MDLLIRKELNNLTVKEILKKELNISNRLLIKLKNSNNILCNDYPVYINTVVFENDIITIKFDFENIDNIIPNNIKLDILYEDNSLLIVNKDSGIPTHPSSLHFYDTLSNSVKGYYISHNINSLIRPVNRLDKNTSGIVVFAKNPYVQECLVKQMKENIFKKQYICIVNGYVKNDTDTINMPIKRKENSIIERCISIDGDNAITNYTIKKRFCIQNTPLSLLDVNIETGRTHQIRVHMKYINHPILGDDLYGSKSDLINRQALHCYNISFIHPITKKDVAIICKIPDDMQKLLI